MQTNPNYSGGPFPISGSCMNANTAAWGVWGREFVVLQVCIFLGVSTPDSAPAAGPPARVGRDFGKEPGGEGEHGCSRLSQPASPGARRWEPGSQPRVGEERGGQARSGSRPPHLPASSRLGSCASLPRGPSRIAAGARDFDGGGVVAAWQRQGAASPSALPLSAAVARADLAAAPRAARIHASREPTRCAHLARWGEAARARDATGARGGGTPAARGCWRGEVVRGAPERFARAGSPARAGQCPGPLVNVGRGSSAGWRIFLELTCKREGPCARLGSGSLRSGTSRHFIVWRFAGSTKPAPGVVPGRCVWDAMAFLGSPKARTQMAKARGGSPPQHTQTYGYLVAKDKTFCSFTELGQNAKARHTGWSRAHCEAHPLRFAGGRAELLHCTPTPSSLPVAAP